MAVNKDDFISWRNQEITHELRTELLEAIENTAMEILDREVPNIDRDQFLKGFIKGMNVAIEWIPEFRQQDEEIQVDQEEEN